MRIPAILVPLLCWVPLRLLGVDISIPGITGIAVVAVAVASMVVEFYKSGDIGLRSFKFDLAFALLAVIVSTATMTVLFLQTEYTAGFLVVDASVAAVVLCDAWIGPVNSFRTALRNFAGAVQQSPTTFD